MACAGSKAAKAAVRAVTRDCGRDKGVSAGSGPWEGNHAGTPMTIGLSGRLDTPQLLADEGVERSNDDG